jgi:predicted transcriptional regulator
MPLKNRSRTEIIRDILQTINNESLGARKTKIMYDSFATYGQVNDYLKMLIDKGLIEHDTANRRYRMTDKGIGLHKLCDQLSNLI